MQNIRPFQIALLGIFAILAVGSLIMLARFQGVMTEEEAVYGDEVIIWGPFPGNAIDPVLYEISKADKAFAVVEYIEKDPRTIESEFVNALAEGNGPDVLLLSSEQLVALRTKLLPIPYDSYSERTFKDRFLDGAEIFARADGIYALPLAVDPMVMYWNRDLFGGAGLSVPPSTWESLVSSVVPALTRRDGNRTIVQSAVAFGEYVNVTFAKEMLLTLLMQSGSKMIEEDNQGYRVLVDEPQAEGARRPLNAALQFFTDFSNAQSSLYSWNRTFENDRIAFLGGDLATYFGYGSESAKLRDENPNLNFDVAPVPQGASATVRRVYGNFYGYAIVRSSDNIEGSFAAMSRLTADDASRAVSNALSLVPANRSLIAGGSSVADLDVAYGAALLARAWLDPSPTASGQIFSQMVDDVVSGRLKVTNAVSDAHRRLELAF